MMKPDAMLFDMDGVLVQSSEAWFCVVEAASKHFGNRLVTREAFRPTFGQGAAADVYGFQFDCNVTALNDFYLKEFPGYLSSVWVNPEAQPLLERLTAVGMRLALVTNTVAPLAQLVLQHAQLAHFFPCVATADRVAHPKPSPDLLLLACRDLAIEPSHACMVGDTVYDFIAAQAAGISFIGLGIDGDKRIERLAELQLPPWV